MPPRGRNGARRPLRRLNREELEEYALWALARRAHSTAELEAKLKRRAQSPRDAPQVVADLVARGWLDDRRFAHSYARSRVARRYGRYRITRELRRRGLADELIEEALAEVFPSEREERALVRKRLERRLRGKPRPYSDKLLRSLYASLLRAGFASAIIRDELFKRARRAFEEDNPEASGPQEDEQA